MIPSVWRCSTHSTSYVILVDVPPFGLASVTVDPVDRSVPSPFGKNFRCTFETVRTYGELVPVSSVRVLPLGTVRSVCPLVSKS